MSRTIYIVYDSKFGNNRQVAGALAGHFPADTVHVHHAKEISPKAVASARPDIMLVGGPLRAGNVSFTISSWIKGLAKALRKAGIELERAGAWGTHGENDESTPPKFSWAAAEPKWNALVAMIPARKLLPAVQGIVVTGMDGPMEQGWQDLVAGLARRVEAA